MVIILVRLTLENFKGLRSFSLKPGNKCLIKGANASGKTTLMDSFLWLLFGKDSQGKADFVIKTLKNGKEIPNIEHSIEAELKIDGQILTLQKVLKECYTKKRGSSHATFTGHKVDHYINGVPVQKTGWDEQISNTIHEETFKLLTSPTYFNSDKFGQHKKPIKPAWERRRELLFSLLDNVPNDNEIISSKSELSGLTEILNGRLMDDHRKVVKSKQTEINKRLLEIPSRIDELNKSLVDVSGYDIAAIQVSIRGLDRKIQAMNDDIQLSNLRKRKAEVEAELSELEGEKERAEREATKDIDILVKSLESELRAKKAAIADFSDEIARTENSIQYNEKEMVRLRAEFTKESDKKAYPERSCPTCGQDLPEAEIKAAIKKHNQGKAERLADINAGGKRLKDGVKLLREKLENFTQKGEKYEKEVISLEEELNKIKKTPPVDITFDTAKIDKLNIQIKAIEKEIAENPPKDTDSLETQRQTLQDKVAEVNAAKKTKTRILELGAEEKALAVEYEELERQISLMDKFTIAQVELLEGKINSKFSLARFKLFNVLINSGVEECCETLYDGVPYSHGLNSGSQILVGLDIVSTLQKHYDVRAPVFIDHYEALSSPIKMDCQTIFLRVSEDKELKVENN